MTKSEEYAKLLLIQQEKIQELEGRIQEAQTILDIYDPHGEINKIERLRECLSPKESLSTKQSEKP